MAEGSLTERFSPCSIQPVNSATGIVDTSIGLDEVDGGIQMQVP